MLNISDFSTKSVFDKSGFSTPDKDVIKVMVSGQTPILFSTGKLVFQISNDFEIYETFETLNMFDTSGFQILKKMFTSKCCLRPETNTIRHREACI